MSGPDYLSAFLSPNKIGPGGSERAASYHRDHMTPNGHTFDVYGRTGLCHTSVFNLYPGSADCHTCGLLDTETTLRPPYYNSIGGYCDDSYHGGADNNVLGYPGGPRGKAYCPDKYAAAYSDCTKLSGNEQHQCEANQTRHQMKKNSSMLQM